MNIEDEILIEHFEIPDDFEIELHVSYKQGSIKVLCINKDTKEGSCIDATVGKFGSKVGTIIDTIVDNIKATVEVKKQV